MGMTIEESKRNLNYAIKWKDRPTDESMMVAIDIMRKYQKIEQILKEIPYGGDATVRRIQELLEDGNDE